MVKASTLIGKPAPPLTLPSVTGETYKLPLGEKVRLPLSSYSLFYIS